MLIIAEIGINHSGKLNLACQLIEAAKNAGADLVKFQKRQPETVTPKELWDIPRDTPWGMMSYIDYRRKLEFGQREYDIIDEFCEDVGIPWFASAWDIESLHFLERYDPPFHKVASAMNTNFPLLEAMERTGRPVIMSAGMNDAVGFATAYDVFGESHPLSILHCVGTYPAADTDLNLSNINNLRRLYPRNQIGYSNHSPGAVPCIAAAALGAEIIEAHITLDRASWGSDQAASIEVGTWPWLVKTLRNVPKLLGTGEHTFADVERASAEKLRWHSSG